MRWIIMAVVAAFLAPGCLSDDAPTTPDVPTDPLAPRFVDPASPTDGLPAFRDLPAEISQLTLAAFGDAPNGVRLKLWNNMAYVATGNPAESVAIFDVTDPYLPERVGTVEAEIGVREGIDVLHYEDRVVVMGSFASPVAGPIVFWDVTDPAAPVELTRVEVMSHTVAAHKVGKAVYNAGFANQPVAAVEIIDATDPDDIHLEKVWSWGTMAADGTPIQPTGCHDIVVDQVADRAYCAAQFQTLIWDVSDPFNPVVLTAVTDPFVAHHNTAFSILDGSVLVIGDEEGACLPDVPGGPDDPAGAVWFYDLQASPPELLGWVSPPADGGPSGSCAAHFGSEVAPGTGYVTFGWFGAGLVLIDATDPSSPQIIHRTNEGGSASDAIGYRGLVFAGGGQGGLQVAVPE